MKRRIGERIAGFVLSFVMLFTTTGIVSSLATDADSTANASTSNSSTSSSSNVAQEGGAVTTKTAQADGGSVVPVVDNGNGTQENPYKIANAKDFVGMQKKINLTSSDKKYFILTANIDLSGISANDLTKNDVYSGSLVSVSRSLSEASANVFLNLDGNGYSIKGLDVNLNNSKNVAIFGYLSPKSAITNLKVSDCSLSVSGKTTYAAILVAENDGKISNSTVSASTLYAEKSDYSGIVAAVNYGTIINSTVKGGYTNVSAVTDKLNNISGSGSIGAVAGFNSGKISYASALNVGAYIVHNDENNSVYGGIVGTNTSKVTDSVSTGVVGGGTSADVAGGVVGKAAIPKGKEKAESELSKDYTLVTISSSLSGCAVIGTGGTADMISECYWSSIVSNRKTICTNYGTGIDDLTSLKYSVVRIDDLTRYSYDKIGVTWGKSSVKLNKDYYTKSTDIEFSKDSTEIYMRGKNPDTVAKINYSVQVTLPSDIGAGSGSVSFKQYLSIMALIVPKEVKGNGSADSPLMVRNEKELSLLRWAPEINCKLNNDVTYTSGAFAFCGSLDGNGHMIKTTTALFTTVYGSVKNLNVLAIGKHTSAIFGKAVSAKFDSVKVSSAPDAVFEISTANTGTFFNVIGGETKIENCRADVVISILKDVKNVGGFAGSISGNKTVVSNSGANADISTTVEKTPLTNVAGFIGNVKAKDVEISKCYVSGLINASRFAFIGNLETDKIKVNEITWSKNSSEQMATSPVDFDKYEKIVSKDEFTRWSFESGASGFFTGNGGKFTAKLPSITAFKDVEAKSFTLKYDSAVINANVTVEDGNVVLNVERAENVITVNNTKVQLKNNETGLTAYISISNGLVKDDDENYTITSGYDLAYIGENISEFKDKKFILMSDIDMSGIENYVPLGNTSDAFSGKFYGNGHTISNLAINGTAKTGIFGVIDGATVKDITINNTIVTADGSYAAVLAGQAIGKAWISDITVNDANVTANGTFAGILFGSLNDVTDGFTVKDITINDSTVESTANYVGAVAGRISGAATVNNVTVDNFTANGASCVGGAVGVAEDKATFDTVTVENSTVRGISEVAGIVGNSANGVELTNVTVESSDISTVGTEPSYVAGGVSAISGATIKSAYVNKSTITAGIAGGIVGKSIDDSKLVIDDSSIKDSEIKADNSNTVAAGIIAVQNAGGSVDINNCTVRGDVVISAAAISAGIVGDCTGENSVLTVKNSTSFANIKGNTSANAVAAAAILGRVGTSAVNNIRLISDNAAGSVSGGGALGGIIGTVRNGVVFSSANPIIDSCVAITKISPLDDVVRETSGMIIGYVESNMAITEDNIDSAVKNVVLSTYFDGIKVYSAQSALAGGDWYDMDKPNGKAVQTSNNTLNNSAKKTVSISNLPSISGFTFNADKGWVSEASERIEVVESTENSVTLRANKSANIGIVAYYTYDKNNGIEVPVHFSVESDIKTPLAGEGTKDSPYIISNAYELEAMADYATEKAYFVLTNDINFSDDDFKFGGAFYNVGNGIVTIGNAADGFNGTFTGLYNDAVHEINGMKISGSTFTGLFGALDGATIMDLVINDADVSGQKYAGVVAGSAKNSLIKNIKINNAKVFTKETGSLAGTVSGYADNAELENIVIDTTDVSTMLSGTSATAESAGGVSAVFSGSINGLTIKNATVESKKYAGGVIAEVRGAEKIVSINDALVMADVTANIAGGIIGKISSISGITVDKCSVAGKVTAQEFVSGAIAYVRGSAEDYTATEKQSPLLKSVVIATELSAAKIRGTAIGYVADGIFPDAENDKTDIFDNVYYSSYQNSSKLFGTNSVNACQCLEYRAADLNDIYYVTESGESKSIPMSGSYLELSDSDIVVKNAKGGFKSMDAGDVTMQLVGIDSDIDGLVSYDEGNSAVMLNDIAPEGAKLVFKYDNGLKTALEITETTSLEGKGTKEAPYIVSSQDDFKIMMQNGTDGSIYYALSNDISLAGVSSADLFAGHLDGNGNVLYDYTGAPLFKVVTGSISNLGFTGFKINDVTSQTIGAIAGTLNGAKIDNCFVIADVKADGVNQDAGIIAGRMINDAAVTKCLTGGKVTGKALAAGGIVGAMSNSTVSNCTSTTYVSGAKSVGGILGDTEYSTASNCIFAGMTETSATYSGNVIGRNIDNTSTINMVYADSQIAKTEKASGSGDVNGYNAIATRKLINDKFDGFTHIENGYPVPSGLDNENYSSKFTTGSAFASMSVRFLSGLNSGTVYNYTDVKADETVNGNAVTLENTDSGLTLTLAKDGDFDGIENSISRYLVPASVSAVYISYDIMDITSGSLLSNKTVGVLLKSKAGESSNSFDLFTSVGAEAKNIAGISVVDGGIYVNLLLPQNLKFTVAAVNESGKVLTVIDSENEGYFVKIENSESVSLTFTVLENNTDTWGLRSVWGSLSK